MLITKFQSISGKDIIITSQYATTCNGIKKTSNKKKTISHRLEAQFNELATVIDKKPNGFVARMKRK